MSANTKVRIAVVFAVVMFTVALMWFFPAPSLVRPMVDNGIAMIVVCGEKRGPIEEMKIVPDPQMGLWSKVPRGNCVAYYHHPKSSSD